ncbi:BppU family phage baseplate upper protein [Enterococcus mundtii]|nr:BppU family phage baseplate upper protein [Enterococcus mundtii]
MVYKTNESIIVIQAEATSPNGTNVVFWSHDRGTAKLRMKLVRKDGIPQGLPEGTTVPIRLMFKSATAEGGYGKHDYLATIEDRVNGIVSIVLEDNILGYVGKVEGSVYIDFPDDRSLDTAGRFTFYIKRSPIDDSTPELEDYYFNGFSQTIDKIEKILADGKQEIDQKIAESETQIDAKLKDTNDKITKANQDVATLNTNIEAQKEKFDAVSIYNKAEVDSKVADLDSVKADKTALSQTNILLTNGLNSKVDKGGGGQITLPMLSTDVKTAMAGGSVPVVGKDSVIGYENIVASSILEGQLADNAVGTDVTTFIKSGKNKFNPNLKIDNGYYGSSNGTWISNESFFHAGFFRCKPGQEWYVSWGVHIAFFKANMKDNVGPGVVFSNGQGGAITIPEGAFYFSVGVAKVRESVFQVELGSTPTTYEKYKLSIPELETEPMNGNKYLLDKTVPVNKLAFADMGKNMFNNQDVVSGYINPTTGTIMANASYVTSDYILVDGSEITLSGIRFYYRYTIDYGRINGGTIESNQNLTLEATSAPYLIRVTPFTNTVGSAQVEKGTEATPFEPYEVVLKHVTVEGKPIKEKVTINLPPTIYTTASKPLNIYTQNLLKHPVDDVRINYGRGLQKRNGYSETFQSNGSLNFEVYDKNGELLNSKVISIVTNNPRTTLVKALLIGDSTIRSENDMNGIVSRKMKEELGDNLTLLGTQGVAPYNHEGRSGWKFADYRTNKDGNLFFNPATNDFDFAYYLAENEIETPDAVFIQLGINDVFYSSNDTAVSSIVQTMIADLNFIASSIKSVDDNIRVVYNLPIPPNENIDTFGAAYPGTRYVQWRYRLNNHLTVQTMIDAFSNSEEIDLLAINAYIDCSVNIRDGVHPTNDGYGQIATQMVAYLNNLA